MIAAIIATIGGCQKEELTDRQPADEVQTQEIAQPDVYVENGYLAFKNMQAVDSVIQMLGKMTTAEKEAWENQIGYKSARAEFDALFEKYDKLKSYEEFLVFKEKNRDKLKFNEKDPDDCSIDYPFATVYFTPVLNSEGVYKVGRSIIKYTLDDHIVIADGDVNKLNNLDIFMHDKMVITMPKLKSLSNKFTDIHFFPEDHPRKDEGYNSVWHTKAGISNRRINHKLFAEQYYFSDWDYNTNSYYWVNGIKIALNQRGQKYSVFKWRDHETSYGISNIKVKVGSEPVWEDNRTYTSGQVKPSINFLLYHAWSVLPFQPDSYISVPVVNFAAKVTFQGFGFDISDYYTIDNPDGYGIGDNLLIPSGGWWASGY